MTGTRNRNYTSRAGEKLEFALTAFKLNVSGLVCADFGSSTGGFVDCLLQHGAKKVYAVETGYGLLDWKLRNDERVVVMEKTNAVYVDLAEKVDLVTIDAGWTKQAVILPSANRNLKEGGWVLTLVKLSFELGKEERHLEETIDTARLENLLRVITSDITKAGFEVIDSIKSPILGAKGKNVEYLFHLRKLN
jgi:23S rRNA (cytidine1920-2'-O)/16S rRNA (cytidine1409-2'-O)-methyltransferase